MEKSNFYDDPKNDPSTYLPSAGRGHRMYYWVHAVYKGKEYLVKPKGEASLTEQAAYQWAFAKFQCNFDIVALPTTNTASASQMLKGRRLDDTGDITRVPSRVGHKVE